MAAITLSSLPLKLFTAARNVSWGILAHCPARDFFSVSLLSCVVQYGPHTKVQRIQVRR